MRESTIEKIRGVNLPRSTSRLMATGKVDHISKETVVRRQGSHYTRSAASGMDSNSKVDRLSGGRRFDMLDTLHDCQRKIGNVLSVVWIGLGKTRAAPIINQNKQCEFTRKTPLGSNASRFGYSHIRVTNSFDLVKFKFCSQEVHD